MSPASVAAHADDARSVISASDNPYRARTVKPAPDADRASGAHASRSIDAAGADEGVRLRWKICEHTCEEAEDDQHVLHDEPSADGRIDPVDVIEPSHHDPMDNGFAQSCLTVLVKDLTDLARSYWLVE